MGHRRQILSSAVATVAAFVSSCLARAQGTTPPAAPAEAAALPLFAVEFKTGPRWDAARPAHEQAHFAEHSAHLKNLRAQGHIVMGARYADKGLMIVASTSVDEVNALFSADLSVRNQVFLYEVHPFQVFYPGCVGAPRRTG